MNVEFLATVAMIAPDPASSRKLYVETLGLALQGGAGLRPGLRRIGEVPAVDAQRDQRQLRQEIRRPDA